MRLRSCMISVAFAWMQVAIDRMSPSGINAGWIAMSASEGRSRMWNHTRGFLRYVGKKAQQPKY